MRIWLYTLFIGASAVGGAFLARGTDAEPAAVEQKREPGDELPEFTPSEKVPADSAVSFPVDI